MKTATTRPTWHGGAMGVYRCPCGAEMRQTALDAGEYRARASYKCTGGHRWQVSEWAGGERWEER